MRSILIRIPDEMIALADARARDMAASTGLRASRSDVIRLALQRYLAGDAAPATPAADPNEPTPEEIRQTLARFGATDSDGNVSLDPFAV